MRRPTYICFPKGYALHLATNSQLEKVMAFFYGLKSLYVGGSLHFYSKRAKEFAGRVGVCVSTYRAYISHLLHLGHVTKEGTTLILTSSRKIAKQAGVSTKRYHKIPVKHLTNYREYIQGLELQEKLAQQTYVRDHKLEADYLLSKGITSPHHLQPAARKRLLRGYNQEEVLAIATSRFRKQVANPSTSTYGTNPYVTLSRKGVAKLRENKAHSGGLYLIRKLKELGWLTEEVCEVDCGPVKGSPIGLMRDLQLVDYTFRRVKGRWVKSLPSLLTLTLPVA